MLFSSMLYPGSMGAVLERAQNRIWVLGSIVALEL